MNKPRPRAFTLVELLVVITIIVVLLALLMPAMDKAIYYAELTVCSSQLRGIGTSVTTYAAANKRYYPDRRLATQGPDGTYFTSDQPAIIKYHESYGAWRGDQRPILRQAMPALNKQLNDPMTGAIDMDKAELSNWIFTPYNLWWGFAYLENGNSTTRRPAMLKIGDSWEGRSRGRAYQFNVLAGDRDQVSPEAAILEAQSSHPDDVHGAGILFNKVMQDEVAPWVFATGTITQSLWWSKEQTDYRRGETDDNFVMGDLSVQRYDRVHYDHVQEMDRLKTVGIFSSHDGTPPNPGVGRYQYVP